MVWIISILQPDFMRRRYIDGELAQPIRNGVGDVLIKMELDGRCHP